jgi:hypothetical protein
MVEERSYTVIELGWGASDGFMGASEQSDGRSINMPDFSFDGRLPIFLIAKPML